MAMGSRTQGGLRRAGRGRGGEKQSSAHATEAEEGDVTRRRRGGGEPHAVGGRRCMEAWGTASASDAER